MRSQWNFCFESKGLHIDQTSKFEGVIGIEQARDFGLAPEEFKYSLLIEPDAEPKFKWMQQTGTLKVVLPGGMDQTKDLAYCIAVQASEQVSFSNGELKLLGGLITGEYLPDNPDEEKLLGEGRYFAVAHLAQYKPPPTFDRDAFIKLSGASIDGALMQQFNAAVKARNPIDIFIGLFKILENFYGPQKKEKKHLAKALKESTELFTLAATHLKFESKDISRALTENDFSKLIDDLVSTRHNCAHLKRADSFGISHGDPEVQTKVEPLIGPLKKLAYEAIRTKNK